MWKPTHLLHATLVPSSKGSQDMSCSARGVRSVCAGVPGNLQGACVGKEKDRACTYTCLHPFALSSFRPFHPLIPSFLSPCIAHPFACSPCLRPFPLPTLSAPCCVSLGEGEERTSHGAEHGTREGAGRGQAGIPSPPAALHPFAPSLPPHAHRTDCGITGPWHRALGP